MTAVTNNLINNLISFPQGCTFEKMKDNSSTLKISGVEVTMMELHVAVLFLA